MTESLFSSDIEEISDDEQEKRDIERRRSTSSSGGAIEIAIETEGMSGGEQCNSILGDSEGLLRRSEDTRSGFLTREIRKITQTDRRNCIYHSGVIGFDGGNCEEIQAAIADVITRGKNCFFKFVIKHAGHYHVIHDCKWSNGQCRCFGPLFNKLHSKRHTATNGITELSETSWQNIIKYHFQYGRILQYGKIGTCDGSELYDRLQGLQSNEDKEQNGNTYETGGVVETCGGANEIIWQSTGGQTDIRSYTEHYTDGTAQNKTKSRKRKYGETEPCRAKDEEAEKIAKLIERICASPITDAERTTPWIESKYKMLNDQDYEVKKAKNFIHMKFSKFTIKDFIDFYDEREEADIPCHWAANSVSDIDNIYFDLDTSIYKCIQLLIWQTYPSGLDKNFDIKSDDKTWKIHVFQYVKDLINFLDKKSGKNNGQYYVSPSCSGKSFFFDMIRDFFLLHGNMSNWNRANQFPLQMCIDKKVIFWNEPNCEPAAHEDLKKLFGGEPLSANIKNRMHVEIRRTPVITTANSLIFDRTPEWNCRLKYYTWQTAPFLLDNGSYRLHPLTFKQLVSMCENYYEETLI